MPCVDAENLEVGGLVSIHETMLLKTLPYQPCGIVLNVLPRGALSGIMLWNGRQASITQLPVETSLECTWHVGSDTAESSRAGAEEFTINSPKHQHKHGFQGLTVQGALGGLRETPTS